MTQLNRRSEVFGGTDQRWLGSREGMDQCRTVTLDDAAWAGKVDNGRLKGGEPIAQNTSNDKWVPYASGGSNGTNKLVGFLRNDIPFREGEGDCTAPMLDHGRIIVKYLPSPVAVTATQTGFFRLIDPDHT